MGFIMNYLKISIFSILLAMFSNSNLYSAWGFDDEYLDYHDRASVEDNFDYNYDWDQRVRLLRRRKLLTIASIAGCIFSLVIGKKIVKKISENRLNKKIIKLKAEVAALDAERQHLEKQIKAELVLDVRKRLTAILNLLLKDKAKLEKELAELSLIIGPVA